ncbi:MAG: ankyrin repeat domain-containing protein [Gammaproteobacteria bacterium]|nr:ankyrin repeat domain-containing protein [Gammaproteobacteria bacterium]
MRNFFVTGMRQLLNNNLTALMLAASNGHVQTMETLLKEKINIDAKDKFGNTALIKSVENGRKDVVIMLLENGANHSIRNNNFENALSIAEKTGQSEVQTLLKNHKGKKAVWDFLIPAFYRS